MGSTLGRANRLDLRAAAAARSAGLNRSGTTCESKFSLVNSILPTIRNEMTPNPYANLILLHTSLLLGTPTALRDQGSESKAPG